MPRDTSTAILKAWALKSADFPGTLACIAYCSAAKSAAVYECPLLLLSVRGFKICCKLSAKSFFRAHAATGFSEEENAPKEKPFQTELVLYVLKAKSRLEINISKQQSNSLGHHKIGFH